MTRRTLTVWLASMLIAAFVTTASRSAVVPPGQVEIDFQTCAVTVNVETGPSPVTTSFVIAFEEGMLENRAVTIFRSSAYSAVSASYDDAPRKSISVQAPADQLVDLPALYAAGKPLFVRAVVDPAPGTPTGASLTKLIVFSLMNDKPCPPKP